MLFCIMLFSTFALHMDSTVDCAQAHCEKGSVARFAITWRNGLLPYLILCAILVTIGYQPYRGWCLYLQLQAQKHKRLQSARVNGNRRFRHAQLGRIT